MKKLIFLALTVVSFYSVSFAAQLPNFSPIYFFGDSLTDMGNNTQGDNNCVNVAAPVTNKTGGAQFNLRTWSDMNQYGFYASPSSSGGNDFAFAGATINPMAVFSTTPPFNAHTTYDITTQEIYGSGPGQFNVRQHHISSNALIAYWGGANDILDTFENAQALTLKFFGANPTSPQARQAVLHNIFNQYLKVDLILITSSITLNLRNLKALFSLILQPFKRKFYNFTPWVPETFYLWGCQTYRRHL